MIVTPPTYVKRDGVQYRIDGVEDNFVFLWSQHGKGFVLSVDLGSLIQKNYHPVSLAMATLRPLSVINGVLKTTSFDCAVNLMADEIDTRDMLVLDSYSRKLGNLLGLDVPCSVASWKQLPIVEAIVTRVPAKELYQGVKLLYGIEIPKVTVNYLGGGYLMSITLEELLSQVQEEGALRLDLVAEYSD